MNHHALANRNVGKFGGFAVIGDINCGGREFYFHGFSVLSLYHDRFRANFFDDADDVFFVAVGEGGQRNQDRK